MGGGLAVEGEDKRNGAGCPSARGMCTSRMSARSEAYARSDDNSSINACFRFENATSGGGTTAAGGVRGVARSGERAGTGGDDDGDIVVVGGGGGGGGGSIAMRRDRVDAGDDDGEDSVGNASCIGAAKESIGENGEQVRPATARVQRHRSRSLALMYGHLPIRALPHHYVHEWHRAAFRQHWDWQRMLHPTPMFPTAQR